MKLQVVTTHDPQPDYLAYPLDQPLKDWDHPDLVEVQIGVHRHVVRFVQFEGRLYALKELPPNLAQREWDLLRHLREQDLPVVEVLGVISDRGSDIDDILITRHLEFSLPFRFLFARSGIPRLQESLIDAMAVLLVRIHLAGFWWGDCSLSNTLFRRDAGALAAWLVDSETGELHDSLSDGQRAMELDIAEMNILGGLLDLEASGQLSAAVEPTVVATALRDRYEQLWAELTNEQAIDMTERHLIDERLGRLNELVSTPPSCPSKPGTTVPSCASNRWWWRQATTTACCVASRASRLSRINRGGLSMTSAPTARGCRRRRVTISPRLSSATAG